MQGRSFAMGVGIGMAAGAVLGAAIVPKKKMKCISGRFIKGLGELIDNVSCMLG